MADPTQLFGVSGGYVDNKMVILINICIRVRTKEILFLRSFCLDQGTSTKPTGIGIIIMFTTPKKKADKVEYSDRLRITAKYFQRSLLKGN
jgi:hypothetical protein